MSVLRSTTRAVVAIALLLGALAAPSLLQSTPANAATLPAQATSALNWLADELAGGGGVAGQAHVLGQVLDFGGGPEFFPDWGLTADTVMDLALSGVRPTEATASLDNIQDHVADYVTSGPFGPADRYAGALGKSLLLAEITGRNPKTFGGFDLESELRARLQTTGIKAGRFTDDAKFGDPAAVSQDFSNGFGQGIAMLALSRSQNGVPASAISFLLDQQCPGGGFRGDYDATPPAVSTRTCTANSEADPDATAIALDVLITVPNATGVSAATTKAVAALLALQNTAGGVPSSSGALNANTTGLAGQALRSAGQTAPADKAATFLSTLQLTSAQVTGGPAAGDEGALAFSTADHDTAVAGGVADSARDKFHRATAQGVLGLGLSPYGVVAAPPVTSSSSTSTTSTTVGSTSSTTAAATSSTAAPTTTAAVAAAHSALPKTGADILYTLIIGLALLAAGETVRRGAREQARRSRS